MTNYPNIESLTLASASPRRHELLSSLGCNFDVVVPQIDETPREGEAPRAFAERMANEKAQAIDADGTIIAADTVVVHQNRILGKPDPEPAKCCNRFRGKPMK
jgi:septum formation protein